MAKLHRRKDKAVKGVLLFRLYYCIQINGYMKRITLLGLLSLLALTINAQTGIKEALQRMNQCVVAFSADNPRPLQLFQVSGTLEQAIEGRTQRMTMADMQSIRVSNTAAGYSVTMACQQGLSCITLVKEDMSVMNSNEAQFFFNNPAAANTFASSAKQLAEGLQKTPAVIDVQLFKTPDGKTPLLPAAGAPPTVKANTTTPPPAKPSGSLVLSANDDDDATPRGTGATRAKETEQTNDEGPAEPVDLFCKQIKKLIQSGGAARFKDIEGKVMNAQTGTNESALKLKGARRSYLSQFEGRRCFIAEMKSYPDNELATEALYDLQSQLEDCLGEDWDNEDKSDDPIYDKADFDVKDVELSNANNPAMPTVRIALAPEGTKFMLFIRIR
jgi:hypothetical protein